jgi:C4-type Zn-finger protein
MIKIILDIASNGIIKTVIDDNINGAGEKYEKKYVYDFEGDKEFKKRIQFLFELCDEVGIETGNKFDRNTLVMKNEWGKSYMPTDDELDSKIKTISNELKYLKSLKKELDELNEKD